MKIAVYNEKGGCGKTTLAVHLALTLPATLVDLDEQRTATLWLGQRNPPIRTVDSIDAAPPGDLVIDFAPGKDLTRANLLARVDLVLIPVRPTFNDLSTVGNAVRIIQAQGKPAAFVVTMLNPRTNEARDVGQALGGYGLPIAGSMSNRVSYARAGMVGGTASDLGDAIARSELDLLLRRLRHGQT
jgi:chromosome partitioning protein